MTPEYLLLTVILFSGIFFSVKKEKLTPGGAITGGVIGCFIFLGAGFTGIAMLGSFFLLGSSATSWKISTKEILGAAEMNHGRRGTGQVLANGGVAGIAGLLSWVFPRHRELFQIMMAAALASATADTLSSELGTLYGKKFYNILSFQHDKRGGNGVISLEGTLIGMVGSILIAVIYAIGFGWSCQVGWIIIAGTFGNIADSILGASLEKKHYLENNAVNLINTLVAAAIALVLMKLF